MRKTKTVVIVKEGINPEKRPAIFDGETMQKIVEAARARPLVRVTETEKFKRADLEGRKLIGRVWRARRERNMKYIYGADE